MKYLHIKIIISRYKKGKKLINNAILAVCDTFTSPFMSNTKRCNHH
jgi:hypothetical protein